MAIEFKVPELGENIDSGDVVDVLVREGQVLAAQQNVVDLETDKAVIQIPCPHAGKVAKVHVHKGDRVQVGQVLLTLESADQKTQAAEPAAAEKPPEPASEPTPKPTPAGPPAGAAATPAGVAASPAARRIARESGVKIGQVSGSGTGGRVTPADVVAATPATEGEQPSAGGSVRRERMSQIRRTIATQMIKSASTIPHVTLFDDADVTRLDLLRRDVSTEGSKSRLSLLPLVIKAVADELLRHPVLNARLDEESESILFHDFVNLGIAVDTPRGLIVPVLRNVEKKSVLEIAGALAVLAERARTGQISLEELRGGTFTISNPGTIGGTYSTPIINHPEAAILLLGRARQTPVVRDGRIETRLMLPLSLSYDHRLIDGADAGRFLRDLIARLESPGRMFLESK